MHIVYPLDDQFDSYTEAVKLASLQYEMYLHEQGKQQNDSWRMTVNGDPAPARCHGGAGVAGDARSDRVSVCVASDGLEDHARVSRACL